MLENQVLKNKIESVSKKRYSKRIKLDFRLLSGSMNSQKWLFSIWRYLKITWVEDTLVNIICSWIKRYLKISAFLDLLNDILNIISKEKNGT
jgi:hypothetical protein